MLEHFCRDLIPFSHKSISVVGHGCLPYGLARSRLSNSSQRVEVRALCRPVKFFHTDLDKPFLYGPCFVHASIVMSNCCHKVGSTKSSRMSMYAVALLFLFTGTRGPIPNHEKLPQTIITTPPNFTALCIGAGGVLLAYAKPRFVRRTTRW
jgi:hypothetical protein